MIESIQLYNFKTFSLETLHVGSFSLVVGANASGKSNIRDALRIINGIGYGYSLGEILGGKYYSGQMVWMPIRGAPDEIARDEEKGFSIDVKVRIDGDSVKFEMLVSRAFGLEGFMVNSESFIVNGKPVYEWNIDGFKGHSSEQNILFRKVMRSDSFIINQWEWYRDSKFGKKVLENFSDMRFLDLNPSLMREPSLPGQVALGDGGENLSAVLKLICQDEERRRALIEWIRELTPMDVEAFEFPTDPAGRIYLVLKEKNGRSISAYSASDGTLRFLAMLAALLSPQPASLYFFEEIDNGIHPSRLRLLVDLIETQTAKGGVQVIATTHSPEMLSIVNENTFQNTSVVYRGEATGEAIIRRVADIPQAVELRKSQGLGRLLAGGWMETALAFTEDDEDGEETPG